MKNHFKFAALICALCFSISPTFAQNQMSKIRVLGNKFVNEKGETVVFRGVNTSDPDKLVYDGHWNTEYFKTIKEWGANIVRFPVHPSAWRRQGEENYLALLDQGVEMAKANGLYVIIDWHSIGNLRTELFQHYMYETSKKETFEFWRTMAKHFKDNNTVAFFELFNEPTTQGGQHGTCSWEEWKALNEEIIAIIRAFDNDAIPLVAGWNWAYDLGPVATNPIDAEGIAYVSHPYPQKENKPWEQKWSESWGFVAEKYPLILTEVGFCGPDAPGAHIPVISDESYGDALTMYTKERGISWLVWVFDVNWSPMMIKDWNFTPTQQGEYFKNAMLEK